MSHWSSCRLVDDDDDEDDHDDDDDDEEDDDGDGQGEAERQLVGANWLRGQSGAGHQPPSEGRDWNVYFQVPWGQSWSECWWGGFQYEAHKNLLKELPDDEEDFT